MDIPNILSDFDAIKLTDEKGNLYWKARDLSKILGYMEYRNFKPLIQRAMETCRIEGHAIVQHFVEFHEMVATGPGTFREVENKKLSKYACLLIVMNVGKKRPMLSQALAYFSDKAPAPEFTGELINPNIFLYKVSNSPVRIEVVFSYDTFWLSQKRMTELFGVDETLIEQHVHQVYASGELKEELTTAKFPENKVSGRKTSPREKFYNLDVIIAVGYRVNSYQATQFRIWATDALRDFLTKGIAPDDKRLEQGKVFGRDYFEELVDRIREIRSSEKRYFQKLSDIYAECSIDYDPKSEATKEFFKNVQNKLHWAITHKTAAEIVYERADAHKPRMGLMTWKNAPHGKIQKTDAAVAKNYLSEEEVSRLNLLATSLLDFAENQALRGNVMTMQEWSKKLDIYLELSDYGLMPGEGYVTPEVAKEKAEKEYELFRKMQAAKQLDSTDDTTQTLQND